MQHPSAAPAAREQYRQAPEVGIEGRRGHAPELKPVHPSDEAPASVPCPNGIRLPYAPVVRATVFRRLGALMTCATLVGPWDSTRRVGGADERAPSSVGRRLHYLWNPENLATGTLRAHLDPPRHPPPIVEFPAPKPRARTTPKPLKPAITFFPITCCPNNPIYSGPKFLPARHPNKEFPPLAQFKSIKFPLFLQKMNLGFHPPQ